MGAALFGELLRRVVPLSGHDVAEILEHQAISHRPFGQIALSWGLCRPQHLWRAWWAQLGERTQPVDLAAIGIDNQALTHVTGSVAREYGIIPIRAMCDQVVLAVSERNLGRAVQELPAVLKRQVRFVLATSGQIDDAIRDHYGARG